MKRVLLPLLALFISLSAMGQQTIQLRSADNAECVKSDMTSLKASFSFSTIQAENMDTKDGEFSWLSMPNTVLGGNEGDPQIPVVNELIAVPFGANPTIRVTSYSSTDYQLNDLGIKTLIPRQPSMRKDQKPEDVPFVYNASAYQTRSMRSEPQAVVDVVGTMRGVQLGKMTIEPVSYDPVNNTLRVFNDIEVEVSFEGADAQATEDMLVETYSPYFDIVYKQLFNEKAVRSAYDDHPDLYTTPVKMLVVTTSTYANSTAFNTWLTWKKQKGIDVDVQTVASGASSSTIRSLIQNRYNTNHPTFLVIIGDKADVTSYTTYSVSGLNYNPYDSDLQYASIDNDVYHDMFMSRMSVSSTTELSNLVNKILMYEKYTMSDPSYLNNALLVAGWDSSWTNRVGKPTIQYANNNYYNSDHGINPYVYITTGSQQTTCWNYISQVGFVNYTAHGDVTEMQDPEFSNSDVSSMTNTNKPLWIVANCCLTANWGNSSTCLGETMIRTANKGAFGYIGSTPESYWYEDYYFGVGAFSYVASTVQSPSTTTTGMYDAAFDDTGFNTLNSMPYIGNVAVTYAHAANYTSSVSDEYYWRGYQCLGDGSVMPYLKVPAANNVSHASALPIGTTSFTVNADAGSYVAITVNNEIIGVAAVPSSGTVAVPITAQTTLGTAKIVVTRNQRQPYIQDIDIISNTEYTITAVANPTEGGTITGAGTYYETAECTLTATPNTHYEFVSWTKGNTVLSTEPAYTFTVTGNGTFTANFNALTQHSLTCPTIEHGTVGVSPTVAYKGDIITLTANPDPGYCLYEWIVTTNDKERIPVVNNQFTMPDSDVTINAEFREGHTVTLASAMNGTISANPTTALEGTTINLTATPASGYHLDNWIVYRTDNMNTTVSVSGNTFIMPDYDVTVAAVFSSSTNTEVTIGSTADNTTAWALPIHVYYNYSLTQQIYTPAEVGEAGTITAISFYYLGSSTNGSASSSGTRNISIYMSNTSTSSLSNNWVNETSNHLVYSGTQTFNSLGWYTFTLNTPFEYDGTSNLLLTVDDNTGSYDVSSRRYFRTYSTGEDRSRYIDSDNTNFDPTAATSLTSSDGSYNTTATDNNIIQLAKTVTSHNGSISVSPSSLSGFNAIAGLEASEAQTVSVVGSNLTSNLTVSAPAGFEVCATANGTYSSTLSLTPASGSIRQMVYVRLSADVDPDDYSGNLTLTSGTATATVSLSGSVVPGTGQQYTIGVTASPVEGGTVTGAGTYYENRTVTLTATTNAHYTFNGWQLNGNIVSTSASYSITVTEDANYTALFTMMPQYDVTVTQAEGGTISANPTTAYPGDIVTLTATANAGSFFMEWIVKDANNQTIAVTGDQFTMPNSNVTVTATFSEGFVITVTQVDHGTISASQTSAQPGEIITLSATPDTDCIFSTWYAYKTGDTRVAVTVVNNSFTMPAYDVTVMAVFKTTVIDDVTIGSGDNADSYLPTYAYYKYSLTQQLFTVDEIGQAGTITALAFKVSNSKSTSRNLSIYLRPSNKSSFSSTSDWETMGESYKVFEGSVSFQASGWTTITLDTPFEYNGIKNLNLCVVDNTGSYVSNQSNSPQFLVYSTGENRALRVYTDDNAYTVGYSNTISGYSGTYVTSNNQVMFTMTVPGSSESLTITPNSLSGFNYVEGHGPSDSRKVDIVGVDLRNDVLLTAPENFEISATADGTYGQTLTIARETSKSRSVTSWNFEGDMLDWTTIDADGDGHDWMVSSDLMSSFSNGHSGSNALSSQSYDKSSSSALTPDNWLVSPQVTLGGTFTMWACAQDASYAAEHFGIFVSTTSNTNTSSFTLLNEWTLSAKSSGAKSDHTRSGNRDMGDWYEFTVDLSAYAGQTGYIAVRHYNCTDMFYINVDDFELDTDAGFTPDLPVVLTPATVFVRLKENLTANTYSGILTAAVSEITGNVSLSGEVLLPSYTKEILPYSENFAGWYLIASPVASVTPSVENGFLANNYDLYYFDQEEDMEWRNYRESNFNLVSGKGYLYANSGDVTLTFTGTPYNGDGNVGLTYADGEDFAGMNLVGNPFAQAATINRDFYRMNDEHSEIIAAGSSTDVIDMMEGVIVVATGVNDFVTFTAAPAKSESNADQSLVINVVNNRGNVIDRAMVRFNNDSQLPKYMINKANTNVSIPQGHEEYAIVKAEKRGETAINFRAGENTTYTLSVRPESVAMEYLHLIDNLTGADIDLLAESEYTFTANTLDYASRFKLVFRTNDSSLDAEGDFAFVSDGQIVIEGVDSDANIQVIDLLGRVIVNKNAARNISTEGIAPGVYVLRLVNGDSEKTQKIVIR